MNESFGSAEYFVFRICIKCKLKKVIYFLNVGSVSYLEGFYQMKIILPVFPFLDVKITGGDAGNISARGKVTKTFSGGESEKIIICVGMTETGKSINFEGSDEGNVSGDEEDRLFIQVGV